MKKIFLSIVIPCFNEERNIRKGKINDLLSYIKQQKYLWEIIIVDDGSKDKSKDLLKKIIQINNNIKIIENRHQGKALTVKTGVDKAIGEYILFTDLDQATPIKEIGKFIPYFNESYDIVIGSRENERKGAPFIRAIMGPAFTVIRKIILNLSEISDTQCGFKAFKKQAAKEVFRRTQLYKQYSVIRGSSVTAGFDVELLFIAKKLGYSIKEVPVAWEYVETRRVSPLKDSLNGFIDLVKIRMNSIKGLYNE